MERLEYAVIIILTLALILVVSAYWMGRQQGRLDARLAAAQKVMGAHRSPPPAHSSSSNESTD